ncbi:MAG: ATP-dependent Clp protease ATP-binding subunit ClpX [Verrucomicrobia bacterium]|jgi:ATP-dependent Clp protease ATP-binding subunit ClpX|nr:ATP-dependent Clp protease ATP-binding subunit ClpX [Verrucomicrobiota bacterium]
MRNEDKKNDTPSPEEFQKQLSAFMKQNFSGLGFSPFGGGAPKTESTPTSEEEKKQSTIDDLLKFDHRPKDVKAYLDRFVIQQDEAKKVLSVALCDHYHHVRLALEGKEASNYAKQNIILIGPTGVGKTYLIRSVADLIGVPFVKADATKFSETGYVGSDVEDLIRELYRRSDNDMKRAQFGIVYLDEVDKIAMSQNSAGSRDVSGRGVQTNLLKLMEETEVSVRSPQDMAGQIQAMMESQRGGKKSASTINTKHVLFIVSGAFDGLEPIIRRRMSEATIGFAASRNDANKEDEMLEQVQTTDLIEFGFEPEFVGRLPVRVVCNSLQVDDLFHILKTSEGSIIRQYEQDFAAYGIDILFKPDGLRRIAEMAVEEKTGARGLMTVCERIFRNFKYELPSSDVKRFEVTQEVVDCPAKELKKLLAVQCKKEREVAGKILDEFVARFEESHGIKIDIHEDGRNYLIDVSLNEGIPVRDLWLDRFKDYQFGLKLIAQNTGQKTFIIDEKAAKDPDKRLSDWVVASYREKEAKAENLENKDPKSE